MHPKKSGSMFSGGITLCSACSPKCNSQRSPEKRHLDYRVEYLCYYFTYQASAHTHIQTDTFKYTQTYTHGFLFIITHYPITTLLSCAPTVILSSHHFSGHFNFLLDLYSNKTNLLHIALSPANCGDW